MKWGEKCNMEDNLRTALRKWMVINEKEEEGHKKKSHITLSADADVTKTTKSSYN